MEPRSERWGYRKRGVHTILPKTRHTLHFQKMLIEINYTPFPAVRSNRNSWDKRTKAYHLKMNELRDILSPQIHEITQAMIEDRWSVTFVLPIAKSTSKKKYQEMIGTYHKQRPDTDNLTKSLKDTVFYKNTEHNDCEVSTNNARKIWGTEWKILFEIKDS